jgi:hypothetical protein
MTLKNQSSSHLPEVLMNFLEALRAIIFPEPFFLLLFSEALHIRNLAKY